MRGIKNRILGGALLALIGAAATGCDEFLEVTDPNVLEADVIDPEADLPMLSLSAFQNMTVAIGNLAVNSAWFTHEARVGDTFPTRNEMGRREITATNGTHNSENWTPLQRAIASAEDGVRTNVPGIALARAAFVSGFANLIQAEFFCEGTVAASLSEEGPRMTRQQILELARDRLGLARDQAEPLRTGGTAATRATATEFVHAANMGLARVHLTLGNDTEAAAAAALVPANFVMDLPHIDDPSNRGRLGNNVYAFTVSRLSLVVPPEYREMAAAGDTRIAWNDANRNAQDGELRFYRQAKYTSWGAPIRMASGLEARYIALEATGSMADRVTFINERRSAGGQPGTFASSDPDEVLEELLDQKSRDFWLEAKRMGDFNRNPEHLRRILPPGEETYYKPQLGPVGDQVCWPVPEAETRRNPNW